MTQVIPVPVDILEQLIPALDRLGSGLLKLGNDQIIKAGLDEAYENTVEIAVELTNYSTRLMTAVTEAAGDADVIHFPTIHQPTPPHGPHAS